MPTDRHPAIYLRVSSQSQDVRSQEPELKRWAAAQDGPAAVWYRDKATGTNMQRPGWEQLWADVLTGQVSRIVCWRLDRLGRTAKGLTALIGELREQKIGLVSLRDGIDLDTPSGVLMAHILASVAQYETEVRSERQRAGITAAKAKGLVYPGRKPGTLKGEPARAAELRAAGMKVREIAGALGVSPATVHRYLAALPGL